MEKHLSNLEAHSEPCHISKMEYYGNSQQLEAAKFFRKTLHLRYLTEI